MATLKGMLGATLGKTIGEGLTGAIEGLTQRGVRRREQQASEEAQTREQQRSEEALLSVGFSPQEAKALSALGPQVVGQLIQNQLRQRQQGPQQPQMQAQQQEGAGQAIQSVISGEEGAPPDISQLPFKQQMEIAKLQQRQQFESGRVKQKKAALEQKRESDAFKITDRYRKEIGDKAEVSRDVITRLKKLTKLGEKGTLDSPLWTSVIRLMGFGDLKILQSPDTQEYNKLIVDFLSGARQMFGARITESQVRLFLKRLPTVDVHPQAKKQVIQDLKYFSKAAGAREKAMVAIIKENNGVPPLNLREKVNVRVKNKLKQYAKKITFVSDKKIRDSTGARFSNPSDAPPDLNTIINKKTGEIRVRDKKTGQFRTPTQEEMAQITKGEPTQTPSLSQAPSAAPSSSPTYKLAPEILQNMLANGNQFRTGGMF